MNPRLLFAVEELLAKVGPRAAALTRDTEAAMKVQPKLSRFPESDPVQQSLFRSYRPEAPQEAALTSALSGESQLRLPGLPMDDVREMPLLAPMPIPQEEESLSQSMIRGLRAEARSGRQQELPMYHPGEPINYPGPAEAGRRPLPYMPKGWDGEAEPGLHFAGELEEPTGEFLAGPIGRTARPGFFPGAMASIEPVMRPSGRTARWDSGPDAGTEPYDFISQLTGDTKKALPRRRPWYENREGIGKVRVANDNSRFVEEARQKGLEAANPADAIPSVVEAVAPEPVPFEGAPKGLDFSILERLKLPSKVKKDPKVVIPGLEDSQEDVNRMISPLVRRARESQHEGESFDPNFSGKSLAKIIASTKATAKSDPNTAMEQLAVASETRGIPLSPKDRRDLRVKDKDAFKYRNEKNEGGQYGKKSKALIGGEVVSDDAYAPGKPGTTGDAFTDIKSGRVTSQLLPMSKVKHLKPGETYLLKSGEDVIPVTVQTVRATDELRNQTRVQDRETGFRTGLNQRNVREKIGGAEKDPMVEVVFAPFGKQNETLSVGQGSKKKEIPANLTKAAVKSDIDMQKASAGPTGKVDMDIRTKAGSVPQVTSSHFEAISKDHPGLAKALEKQGITELVADLPGARKDGKISYAAYNPKTGKAMRITFVEGSPEKTPSVKAMTSQDLEQTLARGTTREAMVSLERLKSVNALLKKASEKK